MQDHNGIIFLTVDCHPFIFIIDEEIVYWLWVNQFTSKNYFTPALFWDYLGLENSKFCPFEIDDIDNLGFFGIFE